MTSRPSQYHIAIAMPGPLAAPSDGFIDDRRIETIFAAEPGPDAADQTSLDNLPAGATLVDCLAKRRANIRFNEVVAQMGFVGNLYVSNTVAAAAFSFDVIVEHGDGSLVTWDETALPVRVLLTDPQSVLVRTIARALVQNSTFRAIDVLDPTPGMTAGKFAQTTSVPRYGVRVVPLVVGALYPNLAAASAAVTVTPLF